MAEEQDLQRVQNVCFEGLCYAVEVVVVSRLHEVLRRSLGSVPDKQARFKLSTPRLEKVREVDLPPWKSRPFEPVVLEIIWYYRDAETGDRQAVLLEKWEIRHEVIQGSPYRTGSMTGSGSSKKSKKLRSLSLVYKDLMILLRSLASVTRALPSSMLAQEQYDQSDPSADVAIFLSSRSVFAQLVSPVQSEGGAKGQWVGSRDGAAYDVPDDGSQNTEESKGGESRASTVWTAGQYCIAGPCKVRERLRPADDNAFMLYRVRDVEMRDLRKSFSGEEVGGQKGPTATAESLSRNPSSEETQRPLDLVNLEFEDLSKVHQYKFPSIDTGLGFLKVSVKYRMDVDSFKHTKPAESPQGVDHTSIISDYVASSDSGTGSVPWYSSVAPDVPLSAVEGRGQIVFEDEEESEPANAKRPPTTTAPQPSAAEAEPKPKTAETITTEATQAGRQEAETQHTSLRVSSDHSTTGAPTSESPFAVSALWDRASASAQAAMKTVEGFLRPPQLVHTLPTVAESPLSGSGSDEGGSMSDWVLVDSDDSPAARSKKLTTTPTDSSSPAPPSTKKEPATPLEAENTAMQQQANANTAEGVPSASVPEKTAPSPGLPPRPDPKPSSTRSGTSGPLPTVPPTTDELLDTPGIASPAWTPHGDPRARNAPPSAFNFEGFKLGESPHSFQPREGPSLNATDWERPEYQYIKTPSYGPVAVALREHGDPSDNSPPLNSQGLPLPALSGSPGSEFYLGPRAVYDTPPLAPRASPHGRHGSPPALALGNASLPPATALGPPAVPVQQPQPPSSGSPARTLSTRPSPPARTALGVLQQQRPLSAPPNHPHPAVPQPRSAPGAIPTAGPDLPPSVFQLPPAATSPAAQRPQSMRRRPGSTHEGDADAAARSHSGIAYKRSPLVREVGPSATLPSSKTPPQRKPPGIQPQQPPPQSQEGSASPPMLFYQQARPDFQYPKPGYDYFPGETQSPESRSPQGLLTSGYAAHVPDISSLMGSQGGVPSTHSPSTAPSSEAAVPATSTAISLLESETKERKTKPDAKSYTTTHRQPEEVEKVRRRSSIDLPHDLEAKLPYLDAIYVQQDPGLPLSAVRVEPSSPMRKTAEAKRSDMQNGTNLDDMLMPLQAFAHLFEDRDVLSTGAKYDLAALYSEYYDMKQFSHLMKTEAPYPQPSL